MTCHPELEWNILTSRHTYNSDETNTDEVLTTIKMSLKSIPLRTAVLFITFLYCTQLNLCKGAPISGCKLSERNALLELKRGLKDNANRLSSWISKEDCCTWEGIACNNITGHVIRLDLRNPHPIFRNPHPITGFDDLPYNRWSLGGKIGTSLLNLKLLQYLDLSMNYFGGIPTDFFDLGIPIPGFIGSLHSLTYLNLSQTGFAGLIPHQLGNLSRLQFLDLSSGYFSDLVVDDALWISGLSSLRHLNMGTVFFQNESNWVEALNMLPSIIEIHLSFCNLGGISLSLPHINFTKLSILDLSHNNFKSKIPLWLFNIKSLTYIDLSSSFFMGSIPAAVGNLTNLHVLDLSDNKLEGWLPEELGSLCNLQTLNLNNGANFSRGLTELAEIFSGCIKYRIENVDLSRTFLTSSLPEGLGNLQMLKTLNLYNSSLYGVVPESLGRLLALEELDLSNNNLSGAISEAHFTNLTRLKRLDLSSNKLVLKVSLDWVPPFRLDFIGMGSCMLGPQFPTWLKTQRNVSYLDISNNGILGPLPHWFSNLFSCSSDAFFCTLDISHKISLMDLSENKLSGEIPGELVSLAGLVSLNLSGNHLTGEIPQKIGLMHSLESLDLSRNELTGAIPSSMMTSLTFLGDLNLSYNNLLGSIPSGTQLYSFSNQSYIGNPGLCGFPLTKTCHINGTDQGLVSVSVESDMWCLYVGMGPGFVVGFWAVLGTLLLKKNWRIAYFLYIDYLYDRVYVVIVVSFNKLRGNVV